MRLTSKDTVGVFLVMGTLAALYLHDDARHQESHLPMLADAGGAATSAEAVATVAFVDFNVVPMDGRGMLRRQIVIVRDGFISRIGDVGVVEAPADAQVVEGDGSGYLVPGLVDAHVHLEDASEDVLPLFLANGVTTVFNLEGDDRHLELRDRARDPDFLGPTIFTSGPFINEEVIVSRDDARRVVQEQARAGYDFVKVHGGLSQDSYGALLETAKLVGIPVIGHAPKNLQFYSLLEGGQAAIVHAEELIYTGLQSLDSVQAARTAAEMTERGTWLTPTLSTFANTADQWGSPETLVAKLNEPDARYLPPSLRRSWQASEVFTARPVHERARIAEMYAFHGPLLRAMDHAGVSILTGTDASLPGMIAGFSLHDELAALEAIGMTTDAVLRAATSNAGRFVRQHVDATATFGTIEVGARADIVFVERDPRLDLGTLRNPLGVMARGTWYTRAQLDLMLARAAGPLTADDVDQL